MFIKVKYGIDQTLLVNPNCIVKLIYEYLRTRAVVDDECELDLYDEDGKAVEIYAMNVSSSGLDRLTPRSTYYLVTFARDQNGKLINPKIQSPRSSKAYKNIAAKLNLSIGSRKSSGSKKSAKRKSFQKRKGSKLEVIKSSEEERHSAGGDADRLFYSDQKSKLLLDSRGNPIYGKHGALIRKMIFDETEAPDYYGQIAYGPDGKQLISSDGVPLLTLLGKDLNPILGRDGKPMYAGGGVLLTKKDGRPLLGPDDRPIYSTEGRTAYDSNRKKLPVILMHEKPIIDENGVLYDPNRKQGKTLIEDDHIRFEAKPMAFIDGKPLLPKKLPIFGTDSMEVLGTDGKQLMVNAQPLVGPDKHQVELQDGTRLYVGTLKPLHDSDGKPDFDSNNHQLHSGNYREAYFRGKPMVGKEGIILYQRSKIPMIKDGKPIIDDNGNVLYWPEKRPLYTHTGKLIFGADSRALNMAGSFYGIVGELMIGPNGKVILGDDNKPFYGYEGRNLTGPDGKPIVGVNWEPLLGEDGHQLVDERGRPLYGADGKPLQSTFNKPILNSENAPIYRQKEQILWPDDSLIYGNDGLRRDLFPGKPIMKETGKLLKNMEGKPIMVSDIGGTDGSFLYDKNGHILRDKYGKPFTIAELTAKSQTANFKLKKMKSQRSLPPIKTHSAFTGTQSAFNKRTNRDVKSLQSDSDWLMLDPKCIKKIADLEKRPKSAQMTDADYLILLQPNMGKFKQTHGTYL